MKVRIATLADIPHLPQIERSAGLAFRGTAQDWIADDIIDEADTYPDRIEAGRVWVAEQGGIPAGFIAVERLKNSFHIREMSVAHAHQGKGLGRALMGAALANARAAGHRAATLTTFRSIPWNAPFYVSLGFEIVDQPWPELAAILQEEAARGLTDRCAMRLTL